MGWRKCDFCGEEVYWAYVLPPNEYSRRWVAFEDEDLSECHFDSCPGSRSIRRFAKERLSIRGPMTALFSSEGLVENGLVEQAKEGVFLSSMQVGKDFNALYKKIEKDWFFHNPTRANVGSLGIVPEVPDDAITSPEYQVWRPALSR